jgi:hypothetical protein
LDPTKALAKVLLSLDHEDIDAAEESLTDLMDWLKRGGFFPEVSKAITEFQSDEPCGYRPCNEVGERCKAPPALADSKTKATCYQCGMPVCVGEECSKRMKYLHYGVQRVCVSCQVELKKS